MELLQVLGIIIVALFMLMVGPLMAGAHCDTMDGPTAKDGKKALESNNINYALKWILPQYEDELQSIFEKCIKVRTHSSEAKEIADRFFLESLVRFHRAGEGEPFEGLKPSGTPIDEKVAAADKSIEIGNLSPLEGLVSSEELHELKEKFERVMMLKNYDQNNVQEGREYIEAYVTFFKMAEGEEHEHAHAQSHGQSHEHGH
ncbi:MAG: DUF6448 family protein [Clostridiaceae bacterium]